MGSNLYGISTGSCIACPTGKYASSSGSTACTSCPNGRTTFTSNQYSSGTTGFAVGATSADQCVEVPKGLTCSQPPCGFLAKDMSSNSWTGMDYSYPGSYSLSYRYLAACQTFGQLLKATATASLDPTVGSANQISDCAACPDSQKYFYAGGESSVQQINNYYNGFSTQLAQYVYGTRAGGSQQVTGANSGGGIVYLNYFSQVYTPECLTQCPEGTGDTVTIQDSILTCVNCAAQLGQYNPKAGSKCVICPKDGYPKGDRAKSCEQCPYPYISDWNEDAGRRPAPAGMDSYGIMDYARNVLQYRSCKDDKNWSGSRALCLCLPTGKMLGIILPITFFFLILITGFIVFAVGFKTSKKDVKAGGVEMVTTNPSEDGPVPNPDGPEEHHDLPFTDVAEESVDPLGRIKHKPVLIGWRVLIGLLAYVLVPFVDNMTDLAFIVSNPFYNVGLFVAMIVAYCAPALMFFKTLVDKKCPPKFYIVPMPERFLFPKYDALWKVVVGVLTLIPFVILNLPVLLPWTFLGCLLYTTKAFAIRPVANLWTHVWNGSIFAKEGTEQFEQRRRDLEMAEWHPIDEKILNESLMAHIALETFPIVAIQFINVSYLFFLFIQTFASHLF